MFDSKVTSKSDVHDGYSYRGYRGISTLRYTNTKISKLRHMCNVVVVTLK